MLFSVGVEDCSSEGQGFGLIVPALCNDEFMCDSAADNEEDLPAMATEAILMVIEAMGDSFNAVKDLGVRCYSEWEINDHCDWWFQVEVELPS